MPHQELSLYVDSLYTSPYAMSVFVTLVEKGLPFELHTVDLETQENRADAYAKRSPTQKVPLLVHDAFHLNESSAISEYLEERYPAPAHAAVYPADLQQRAIARQIQAWLRSDLMPIRVERSTEVIFLGKRGGPLTSPAQDAAAKLFAAVDTWLADGATSLFGQWCIADTDLALMLNRLIMNGDEVPHKLKEFANHQWQRPSVQQWVTMTRK